MFSCCTQPVVHATRYSCPSEPLPQHLLTAPECSRLLTRCDSKQFELTNAVVRPTLQELLIAAQPICLLGASANHVQYKAVLSDGEYVAVRLMVGNGANRCVAKGVEPHPNLCRTFHVHACLSISDIANPITNSVSAVDSRPLPTETVIDDAGPPRRAAAAEAPPATSPPPLAPPPPPPRQSKAPPRASILSTKLRRVGLLLQRYRAASREPKPAATTAGSADAPTHGSAASAAAAAAAACTPFGPASPNSPLTAVRSVSSIGASSIGSSAAAGLPTPMNSTTLWGPAACSGGRLGILLSEGAPYLAPTHNPQQAHSQQLPLLLLVQQQQQQQAFSAGTGTAGEMEAARDVNGVAAADSGDGCMTGSKGPGSLASLGGIVATRVCSYVSGGGGGGGDGIVASPWANKSGGRQSFSAAGAGEPSGGAMMGVPQVLQWLRSIGAKPGKRLTIQVSEWCDGGSLQHTLQQSHRSAAPSGGRAISLGSPGAAGSFLDAPSLRHFGVKSTGDTALGGGVSSSRSRCNLATWSASDDGTLWIMHPAPPLPAPPGPQQPVPPPKPSRAPPLSMLPLSQAGYVPASLVRWAGRIAALRCAQGVAEALAHLHESGYYHSNLNPTTILCCRTIGDDAPGPLAGLSAFSGGGQKAQQAAEAAASPPPNVDTKSTVLEKLIASTPLGRIQCKVTMVCLTPVAAAAAAAASTAPPSPPLTPALLSPPLPASPASVTVPAPPGSSGGGGSVVDDDPQAAAVAASTNASIFTSLKAAAEAVATAAPAAAPASAGGSAAASKPSLELSLNTTQWGAIAYVAPELVSARIDSGGSSCGSSGSGAAAAELPGPAANAFAFGMILWQLVSGRTPHFELHPAQILVGRVTGDVDASLTWPEDTCAALRRLGEACLQRDPRRRPTLRCAAEVLSAVAAQEAADCRSVLALHCG